MTLPATDRIDLVRLFLRAAETGQISEAARFLGLSQPTASRSLKRLEALVGARLVDRSPQGLSLTQAGRDFLSPARRLVEGWHQAVDAATTDATSLSGLLRVAVPTAVGQDFLAVIAARFLRAHPGLAIDWNMRDDAVDVTAGGYDLWARVGEIRRDDLVVRHIYRIGRTVVAAPTWPVMVHPRDLEPLPAVRLSSYVPGTVELTLDGEAFQLRQRAVFTTDSLYAARAAVIEGVGYAVLPLWCVHKLIEQGLLKEVCKRWRPPITTFSLAYTPSRGRSSRVAALIAFIRTELESDAGLGVAFLQEVGATASVQRVGVRPTA